VARSDCMWLSKMDRGSGGPGLVGFSANRETERCGFHSDFFLSFFNI
jgi:hypothetical protein